MKLAGSISADIRIGTSMAMASPLSNTFKLASSSSPSASSSFLSLYVHSPNFNAGFQRHLWPLSLRVPRSIAHPGPLNSRCAISAEVSSPETAVEGVNIAEDVTQGKEEEECCLMRFVQKWAVCLMASVTLASMQPLSLPAQALVTNHIFDDLAILISGPPVKDPNALLRHALPIDSKPFKEVQKSLEDITDNLKLAGAKAFDPVERSVRQAARALSQNKSVIIANLAPAKKETGQALLDKLTVGLQELQKIVEDKSREEIAPKQKELLYIMGDVEEAMVDKFPFEVPEEYANKPLLKGRARVEMKVKVKDNPNLKDVVFQMVLDGYNAPVTAGNFVDLIERHFYDGMEIQRADGFVVQTGDPDGPAEGFVDPSTGKIRTIPLEIMVEGDKQPIYEATLEELGRYKASTKLPFNAFGTLAMARDEFEDNSASSQIFWLLKESELTPSNANILDGRYAVFGYVTENEELLADLKVGDVIESIRVVAGLDNLVNPSYKIS